MPYRAVVSSKLAKLFGVLSHPVRVRIIEELRAQDLTVSDLKDILEITHTATSQQLAVLRNSGLVVESRQGRNVFYHLRKTDLADWIMDGLKFISPDQQEIETVVNAIKSARNIWSGGAEQPKNGSGASGKVAGGRGKAAAPSAKPATVRSKASTQAGKRRA